MALTKKLDAIGEAIREKTGDTNKYTLDEMVTAIGTISGGGGGSAAGLVDGTTTVLKDGDAKAVNMAFINSNLTEINLSRAESVDFVNNNTSWGIKCYVNGADYSCGAFGANSKLAKVSMPKCKKVGDYTFIGCTALTDVDLSACTSIGQYAFYYCIGLKTLDKLGACLTVGDYAFSTCKNLTTVSLPACTSLGQYAFYDCTSLASVELPACTSLKQSAFNNCTSLSSVDLERIDQNIQQQTFCNNYSLTAVIIRTTYKVIGLSSTSAFSNCYHFYGTVNATYNPDGLKDGYIYVPDTLVDSYKTATNWVTLADQIKPLSELPTA